MSAFICNKSHITALAVYAARHRLCGDKTAQQIGEMLYAENVASVNYLYGVTTRPDYTLCEWAAFHPFSHVQIVKAARCLRYQSCEHPGWDASEACRLLDTIIGDGDERLPGYDEAEWQIWPPAATAA